MSQNNPYRKILRSGVVIERHLFSKAGKTYPSKSWYLRVQRGGFRRRINLGTDFKKAEKRANEIFGKLSAEPLGEVDLRREASNSARSKVPTLGAVFDQIELDAAVLSLETRTAREYRRSTSLIIRTVLAARNGGEISEEAFRALPVTALSRNVLTDFMRLRVPAGAETDRRRLRSLKLSANRHMRNAKAAFRPSIIEHMRLQRLAIPDMSGMRQTPLFSGLRLIYELPRDEAIMSVAKAIRTELIEQPDLYLSAILALHAGLRRNEIVYTKWDWLSASNKSTMTVREGNEFRPKSGVSRTVRVHRWLIEELTRYRGDGDYVVPGESRASVGKRMNVLVDWLQSRGLQQDKPLHELRKWFGAFFATRYGITHAQRQLGHSTPLLTNDYYAGVRDMHPALMKIWDDPMLAAPLPELLQSLQEKCGESEKLDNFGYPIAARSDNGDG